MNQLAHESYEALYMVFGVVSDKDLESIIKFLPKKAYYFYCKPDVPRGMDVTVLKKKFDTYGFTGEATNSVIDAMEKAKVKANSKDLIYVGGSTFVVAEII